MSPLRLAEFSKRKTWIFLAFFILFLGASVSFARFIINRELSAATRRLTTQSGGASRNAESRFENLRDDFRVLASVGAINDYIEEGPGAFKARALLRRFFARYQEYIDSLEIRSSEGLYRLRIARGNYLELEEFAENTQEDLGASKSSVIHRGDEIVVREAGPPGEAQGVIEVRLILNHDRFFEDCLAGYLLGHPALYVWSIDEAGEIRLLREPPESEGGYFKVRAEDLSRIEDRLAEGLEGVETHVVLMPDKRNFVSAYTPVSLGGHQMGLVFSTDRQVHLGSPYLLSTFLGLTFLGTLLFAGFWFAVSYARVRDSQRAQAIARDAAEAADRAKSEFLAVMSHEIRTPLNAVLGYAELLSESKLTPEQRRCADTITTSGTHLLTILNDILDLSRVSAGKFVLRSEPFDPVGVVEEVVEMMEPSATERGLDIRMEFDASLPATVAGDEGRLRQVLFNLVGNAVKFTDRGSIDVKIARRRINRRWWMWAEVCDTGAGIPEEIQASIFEPFAQGEKWSTNRNEGTGLGLSICKGIIESMGGQIGFRSTLGCGTVFEFEIPLNLPTSANSERGELEGIEVVMKCRERGLREGLEKRLSRAGAIIHACESDGEAHELLETRVDVPFFMGVCERGGWIFDCRLKDLLQRRRGGNLRTIALVPPGEVVEAETLPVDGFVRLRAGLLQTSANLVRCLDGMKSTPTRNNFEGLSVLVAEDNHINRDLIKLLLESRGATVAAAENGREALTSMRECRYDLVLMDVEMPMLDGIEATRIFRDLERHSESGRVPVIGLSARAFEKDKELARAAGMDGYLSKPVKVRELEEIMAKLTFPNGAKRGINVPELDDVHST